MSHQSRVGLTIFDRKIKHEDIIIIMRLRYDHRFRQKPPVQFYSLRQCEEANTRKKIVDDYRRTDRGTGEEKKRIAFYGRYTTDTLLLVW